MKYKVGDKVRVKNDLIEREHYRMEDEKTSNFVTSSMMKFRGHTVTIATSSVLSGQYEIEEDDKLCYWTDGMFEGLAEESETPKKFHIFDTVKHEKYGIGTIIEADLGDPYLLKVDFDEWHGELMDNHTCFCAREVLTLVEAYTGDETI